MANDGKIVRDEKIRQAELLLQIFEQIDDLRLNGDVERRDRLVANDEFRINGERACDADALALAAGKLVRITVGVIRLQPDQTQQFLNAIVYAFAAGEVMYLERLADDVADGHARVERRKRILKDDLHLSAQMAQLRARAIQDVAAVEPHFTARRRQQTQDDAADRRLPRAGLADEAERFARSDCKVDAVDGFDVADMA